MSMQIGAPGPEEQPARDNGPKAVRYLYIVARGADARSTQVFAAMRRDMSNASVELMYDRRNGERRSEGATTNPERRAGDRRRQDATQEIANTGWARVQVD